MQFETQSLVSRLSFAISFIFLGAVGAVQAQAPASFPSKQIDITVPYPPGGGVDLLARLIAAPLGVALGQVVVVENKAGAGGTIAARYVSGRPSDGHSLLMMNDSAYAIAPALFKNLQYDPKKDLAVVINVAYAPSLLVASLQSPYKSLADVVKAGAAKDAKLSFGSCGAGTAPHLVGELLNITFNMKMTHIPYKGCGPAFVDVLGGHVELAWVTLIAAVSHIKSGKLKALAISSKDRSAVLPDVPTVAESGAPGFHISSWQGLAVPGGTPESVKTALYDAISKVMKTDAMQKRLFELGLTPADDKPAVFQKLVDGDIDRFAKLVKQIGLTID